MLKTKLSAMMFGQYFIWGAWWVTLGTYMNAIGFDAFIGQTYSTQGWAAIVAPLIFGVIADKYVPANRVFSVLHLGAGVMLLWLSTVTASPSLFFTAALGVMVLYMPTIALSNTIAFQALGDVEREFPAVRVFGTVGWIVAGLIIGALALEQTVLPIRIAAAASFVLGAYSFVLPSVPKGAEAPTAGKGIAGRLGLDVFSHIRSRSFWVFIVASLLICIPLSFYYSYTNTFLVEQGVRGAAAVQTLGQVSEIVFLLALPFFLARFGLKKVIIVGMVAWALRYAAFAAGAGEEASLALLIFGIVLHGVCYDFFFVAGQIYADKSVPAAMRARVQAFLSLVTLGLGTVVGTYLAGAIYNANTVSTSEHNWPIIWLIPAGLAIVVALGFALTFKDEDEVAGTARLRTV